MSSFEPSTAELEKLSKIIVRLVTTEKAYWLAERQNYLTLIVDRSANKRMIKEAVEKLYGVKVVKVNTMIDRQGLKKAYVRLAEGYNARDILERGLPR